MIIFDPMISFDVIERNELMDLNQTLVQFYFLILMVKYQVNETIKKKIKGKKRKDINKI